MFRKSVALLGVLLYGGYGTGKTTLARLLPDLIERRRTGISDAESGYEFVACASLDGDAAIKRLRSISQLVSLAKSDLRYFILDEFDVLTEKAQANFKALMSATKRSVFILTTNNLHEIDRGVHDRCWGISMNAASDERWLPAAHQMLQKLGVSDVTDEAAIGVLATCKDKSARQATKDEMKRVEKIIAADSNATRNMLAFKLSVLGGMRVGEVAALTVGQVRGLDGKAVAVINLSKEQTKGA